ncbi:aminoglycoside phosphotransferase family protein [Arthrobacter sp. ISL-48]|uniref:aminoglycoside phosphotransferase family protein n=1 Tax=Arthrobacter sp. ISL-48 TaxID=2819110 RepID=UPI001BE6908C|nr:aminoglycoside phosphotransferase family protein [Arthrobacter sp. ISL-48]MBT2533496.1 aminoglycoside phosphotransferase family protein [Arthrobacter sp. ISL-48]
MRFIDSFLTEHRRELELDRYGIGRQWHTVLLTPRFVTSRHVVALVFAAGAREPSLVVKVPRQPGDNDGVRHEAEVLEQLKAGGMGSSHGVPEVAGVLDVGAHTVLVETAVTGAPLDPRLAAADLSVAVRAGTHFVGALPCTRSAPVNADWYERTVTGPLQALIGLVGTETEISWLVERTHEKLAPLRSAQLPAVVEHGDLSHPNLFLQSTGRLQVVDWERSRTDGLPGHDLVFYLQYLSESNERAFSRVNQLAAFEKAFGSGGWALAPLRKHLELRGVDSGLLPLLVTATWARSAATLAYRLAGQAAAGGGTGQVRTAVASDRDFWLWRHVVDGQPV